MKLILCRSNSLTSWLLRFAMWSRWSHSALWDEEMGFVYDSTFTHGGVRIWRQDDWFSRYPKHEVRTLAVSDPHGARMWLEDQLGKPYDWTALVGFLFRADWQAEDSWFCSEFCETFRNLFVGPVFRASVSRVTPGHQDMIA